MTTTNPRIRWICRAAALAIAALVVSSVARFYHPRYGFTALIAFANNPEYQLPALQSLPHLPNPPWASYDGQFYAQLALDPLLRDSAIDRVLDAPIYRARRILFSWTAWALGLGRPAWILTAYALQNVLFWLLLAILLARWLPPDTPRGLAFWTACLLSHGMLMSIRLALLDGPSVFVIALAVAAAERGRMFTSAVVAGIAGLGKETNLLSASALPTPERRRGWLAFAAALVVVALPLLIWQDYLHSIYRSTSPMTAAPIQLPLVGYVQKWQTTLADIWSIGIATPAVYGMAALISVTVQCAYLLYSRQFATPWWRVAAAYGCLILILDRAVWEGYPSAVTRVTLPLVFGFNIVLARDVRPQSWVWFVLGNVHLIPAATVLPLLGAAR